MKRVLKWVGVGVGVLVLGVVVALGITFGNNPEIPDGREVAGFARVVKDGYVGVAMLDLGDGSVALVDAGDDGEGKAILAELSRRKLGPDAVKAILLTHGHPDHVAACARFPKAEVMALEPDVALAEARDTSHGPLTGMLPVKDQHVKVTRALKDGETVQLGNLSVRVFAVPGHTPGSAAFLTRGVLFLGDSADATKDGKLASAKYLMTDDLARNEASLKALAAKLKPEEVQALVFSHTGVLEGGLAPLQAFAAAK